MKTLHSETRDKRARGGILDKQVEKLSTTKKVVQAFCFAVNLNEKGRENWYKRD